MRGALVAPAARGRRGTTGAVAAGILTALLAFGALAYRAQTVGSDPAGAGRAYAPAFRGQTTGPGALMNAHDGQAFGSLALDPLLSHPSDWVGGRSGMAYRAARPLLGWLVMLTSFGSTAAAGWSLLAWTAVGTGAMAAGAFVLARRWGRQRDWVPLLLLLPGVAGQVLVGGLPDALAAGLALLGLAWWLEGRDRWAVVALCLAALSRETTLLVALALLLASARDRRRATALLAPFAVYVAWVGVVWLRIQALPTDAGQGRLALPPGNLTSVVTSWSWVEILGAASIVVLSAVAWKQAPGPEVRWLVVLSAAFALTLGPAVLRGWDFTRPLLPITIVGACLLAGKAPVGEPGGGHAAADVAAAPTALVPR